MDSRLEGLTPVGLIVDLDRNLWVFLGVPVEVEQFLGHLTVTFPDHPHVFVAHDLYINDKKHTNVHLKNVTVIIAHGCRDDNTWQFTNGQPVVGTVNAYNDYASINNLPRIELVMACNDRESLNDNTSIDVLMQDLDVTSVTTQVVGAPVYINQSKTIISDTGHVTLAIWTDENFWGLDELIEWRSIKREVKLRVKLRYDDF